MSGMSERGEGKSMKKWRPVFTAAVADCTAQDWLRMNRRSETSDDSFLSSTRYCNTAVVQQIMTHQFSDYPILTLTIISHIGSYGDDLVQSFLYFKAKWNKSCLHVESINIHLKLNFCRYWIQDFADIVSEPSLEGAAGTSLEGLEDKTPEESFEMKAFSPATLNTVIQVHQRLCLGYAQSLWYKSTAPANHSKEHIKALLSSYQIASPVMSHFYHLIG